MNTAMVRSLLRSFSFSRHGAGAIMGAARRRAPSSTLRRISGIAAGSSLIGVAVALLVHAELGLPPYDVLSSALAEHLGLSLGQSGWLLAGILFAFAAFLGQRPSPWGAAYVIANGFAIDAASGLLTRPETMAGRWTFVIAAIVVMATGISFVVYSGVSGGPFELLMKAGEVRGINPVGVRYGLDLGVLGCGLLLAGNYGYATIVYAFSFGLVMKAAGQALLDHDAGRRMRLEGNQRSGFVGSTAAQNSGGDAPDAATRPSLPADRRSRRGARPTKVPAGH